MHTQSLNQKNLHNTRADNFIPTSNGRSQNGYITPHLLSNSTERSRQASPFYMTNTPALTNIGMKIALSQSLKEVTGTLYHECSGWIDTTNFALAIYDSQSDTLTFSLLIQQGQRGKSFSVKLSLIRGLVNETLTQKIPILIPDLLHMDPPIPYQPIQSNRPIRSWLSIPLYNPLRPQENAQAMIAAWSEQPNAFTEQQSYQLSRLGPPAAIAIRNIQINQKSQRRALKLAVINDIVEALASTLQLDEVLNRIMELVEGMLGVKAGALLLTDPATDELVFQVALGAKDIKPFRIPKGQNLASYVALVSKKSFKLPRITPTKEQFIELASHLRVKPRNCLYVPLILQDHVIGIIGVMNKSEGTFSDDDQSLLESIATYAAIAIDNARLHENMLAERDKVVGIEEQVRKKVAHDLHDGPTQLVSAILMRLDFFKNALKENPDLLESEIANMKDLADRALHQMRTMLVELFPLDLEQHGQGLGEALRVLLNRRQKEISSTKLSLHISSSQPNNQLSRQDSEVEKAIFIIVREMVNNAIKHSGATRIAVYLEESAKMLNIRIVDNGKGFDAKVALNGYAQSGSLGMISVQERAEAIGGELDIDSVVNEGTCVTLKIPKTKAERLHKRGTTGRLKLPVNMLAD